MTVIAILVLLIFKLDTVSPVHIQQSLLHLHQGLICSTLDVSSFLSSASSACDLLDLMLLELTWLSIVTIFHVIQQNDPLDVEV